MMSLTSGILKWNVKIDMVRLMSINQSIFFRILESCKTLDSSLIRFVVMHQSSQTFNFDDLECYIFSAVGKWYNWIWLDIFKWSRLHVASSFMNNIWDLSLRKRAFCGWYVTSVCLFVSGLEVFRWSLRQSYSLNHPWFRPQHSFRKFFRHGA